MKGMNEFLNQSESPGMQCMVDGTVPKSAGLSSSSALVCCAALAVMHASGQSKSKVKIFFVQNRGMLVICLQFSIKGEL